MIRYYIYIIYSGDQILVRYRSNITEACSDTLSDGKTCRNGGRESESERGEVDDNVVDNAWDNAKGVRTTRVPKKDPERRTLVRNSFAR